MNKKSRFAAFLLSFIPGLGHFYLGFSARGFIFLGLYLGALFGGMGLAVITGENEFFMLLPFALLVIWFISMVDAISLVDLPATEEYLKGAEGEGAVENPARSAPRCVSNRTVIAAALSLVPGAGHMYLGFMRYGAELMGTFFMALFLMGWLNMSFFLFLLPIIWFYSLFDAIHRAEGNVPPDNLEDSPLSWINRNPRLTGAGLILLGCLAVLDRIIFPLIEWRMRSYFYTGLVSFILIFAGIKLITTGGAGLKTKEKGGDSEP